MANALGFVKEVTVSGLANLGMTAFPPKKQKDYLEAYQSWVFACVKARAEDVANIKLHLYRRKGTKGEVVEVFDHEVLSLLRSVNPWMTFNDLIKHTQSFKDLAGESFWYLVRSGVRGKGKIVQVWMLRPDYIEIIPDKENFVKAYKYTVPSENPVIIPKEDIIHFKNFNPVDPYRGASIVGALARTVDSDEYAEEYNRKFFKNSALPAVVLSTDQKLSEEIIARAKREWQQEYGGYEKSHKMAILEGGISIEKFSVSQKDMEFLEGQRFTRDKILALFQVPKTVLGMTESVSVSNAEATNYVFSDRVTKPNMRAFVDVLNEFLLPNYSTDLFFDFEDPVKENDESKAKVVESMFRTGAITPNEIREIFNFDRVDGESGMDQYYLPFSVTPVNQDGMYDEEDPDDTGNDPVKNAKSIKKLPKAPVPTMKEVITEKVSDEVSKAVLAKFSDHPAVKKRIEANKKAKQKKKEKQLGKSDLGNNHMTRQAQEAYWKTFVGKTDGYENKYESALKSVFARQKKETIQRLMNTQKSLSQDDINKILFDLRIENKLSYDIILPIIRELILEFGQDALEMLGINDLPFDMTTETINQYLKESALNGVRSINKTTKNEIKAILVESAKNGDSVDQISRKITQKFSDFDSKRAKNVARTEVLKASNHASLEGFKQSGQVVGKEWFTALDELVCPYCSLMTNPNTGTGVVLPNDEKFFLKGETIIGTNGKPFYVDFEDVQAPPLHPNCRCTLLPVLREI